MEIGDTIPEYIKIMESCESFKFLCVLQGATTDVFD